jgi:hypothetical protein
MCKSEAQIPASAAVIFRVCLRGIRVGVAIWEERTG